MSWILRKYRWQMAEVFLMMTLTHFEIQKRGSEKLKGDGDFRSEECIEYLKEADIVVTNPLLAYFGIMSRSL